MLLAVFHQLAGRLRRLRPNAIDPRPPLAFLGRMVLLLAGALLLPAVVSFIYGEVSDGLSFVGAALVTAFCGLLAQRFGGEGDLYRREGVLIVAGGWMLASLFGSLPYIFTGTLTGPADALFEAASGFTTTGATVMLDIEAAGRGVLFWRSFTQWLGGMGIIVLFVALLPELGPGARFLYKLEVPGPTAEALRPRVADTAGILWRLYVALTIAETGALMLAGLDFYDALTHTFTTLSTGGFSPYADSIAAFSTPVHVIIIVFMILAGGNFSLYYGLASRREWNLFKDFEFRFYLLLISGATLVVALDLQRDADYAGKIGVTLRDAAFQVTSIITTTGFATADFETWPQLSRLLLVTLMFVGGCAGSTSGSMKVMRMLIGIKAAIREARLSHSPSTVIPILVGGKAVPESVVKSVSGFFILFLTSWGVGALLLATTGLDPVTAGTASIATLGNVGPGLAAVGPIENFSFFAGWQKLVMVLLMLLGRLEVYSIAALFTVRFWHR